MLPSSSSLREGLKRQRIKYEPLPPSLAIPTWGNTLQEGNLPFPNLRGESTTGADGKATVQAFLEALEAVRNEAEHTLEITFNHDLPEVLVASWEEVVTKLKYTPMSEAALAASRGVYNRAVQRSWYLRPFFQEAHIEAAQFIYESELFTHLTETGIFGRGPTPVMAHQVPIPYYATTSSQTTGHGIPDVMVVERKKAGRGKTQLVQGHQDPQARDEGFEKEKEDDDDDQDYLYQEEEDSTSSGMSSNETDEEGHSPSLPEQGDDRIDSGLELGYEPVKGRFSFSSYKGIGIIREFKSSSRLKSSLIRICQKTDPVSVDVKDGDTAKPLIKYLDGRNPHGIKTLVKLLLEGPAYAWLISHRFAILECGDAWVVMELTYGRPEEVLKQGEEGEEGEEKEPAKPRMVLKVSTPVIVGWSVDSSSTASEEGRSKRPVPRRPFDLTVAATYLEPKDPRATEMPSILAPPCDTRVSPIPKSQKDTEPPGGLPVESGLQ